MSTASCNCGTGCSKRTAARCSSASSALPTPTSRPFARASRPLRCRCRPPSRPTSSACSPCQGSRRGSPRHWPRRTSSSWTSPTDSNAEGSGRPKLRPMQTYLVGGAIRDALLGQPGSDHDWVVVGATPEEMVARGFLPVGRDFPVFLHPETREEYALARTERKSAPGYRGFVVHAAPDVTLEQDLARRDLTINAIALPEARIHASDRLDLDPA